MSVETILTEAVTVTDAALERLLPGPDAQPHSIHRAMRHSTFAGGKRLRPALVLEAARMVAGKLPEGVEECGAAIEMLNPQSPPIGVLPRWKMGRVSRSGSAGCRTPCAPCWQRRE